MNKTDKGWMGEQRHSERKWHVPKKRQEYNLDVLILDHAASNYLKCLDEMAQKGSFPFAVTM